VKQQDKDILSFGEAGRAALAEIAALTAELVVCEKRRADTNAAMQRRHSEERQLDRDNRKVLADQLEEARRTIAHRDERIAELNTWLDSHAPMVER